MQIHTVKSGETVFSIAASYGTSTQRLIQENGLPNPNQLAVGQTLVIQYPKVVHTVALGESAYGIALAYRIPLNELYRNNPGLLSQPYLLPGQQLVIEYDQQRLGRMDAGGYAYPFIEQGMLRSTLPYLSYLMPFTTEIREDGSLQVPEDDWMIAQAKEFGVAPLLHLSNLREPYGFDGALAHRVLTEAALQRRVIRETVEAIQTKGYEGLDVDFEYLYEQDSLRFAEFLGRLREQVNALGYEVLAALAPRTSDEENGPLTAGHDYRAVGSQVDAVLLMTYEWGYRLGPPMAVAPIFKVRPVLDYAVTRIPPEKLLLGVPNYGYDWPLPYIQGETRATSLSNQQAVSLAYQQGAEIQYSAAAQSPYFFYTAGGVQHNVWFEDARSIQAKLELVDQYHLRGVGYWNLMRPFPENWAVLNALYEILQAGPEGDLEV